MNMMMYQWLRRVFMVAATLCIASTASAVEQPQEYLLNAGDILFVSVWQEKDMQHELLVSPDGTISFPLIGHFQASGKSTIVLTNEIKRRLVKYIPDANVTVTLRQTPGNRVFVVGQVNRPGEILMRQPMDVLQVLASAGGGNAYADLDDIKIIRRESDKQAVYEFDFNEVARGKQLDQNLVLQNGDVVIVP